MSSRFGVHGSEFHFLCLEFEVFLLSF